MRSLRKLPELCLFFYFATYGSYLIAKDQLYLDKACQVNLLPWLEERGLNSSVCTDKAARAELPEELSKEVESKSQSIGEHSDLRGDPGERAGGDLLHVRRALE